MIWDIVKEERKYLRAKIDLFNISKLPYSSINYLLIAKVIISETRQRIDRDTAKQSTTKINNATSTKTKSTLHKKMLFEYTVALPPHEMFCTLIHKISPDSTSNGSDSTGRQGTSNRNLKIFLINLSITRNNINKIAVFKAVNKLMKVIQGIEGYTKKVKINPWKSKHPNL